MKSEERLEQFEALLSELQAEYEVASKQVETMKAQNKTKTATFKQLLARKMSLRSFLDAFDAHGLL